MNSFFTGKKIKMRVWFVLHVYWSECKCKKKVKKDKDRSCTFKILKYRYKVYLSKLLSKSQAKDTESEVFKIKSNCRLCL